MRRLFPLAAGGPLLALLLTGCIGAFERTVVVTATPMPATETPLPRPTATSTAVPSPTPTITPTPELGAGQAIVVGGLLRTRSEPSSTSERVAVLADKTLVNIVARVDGENWLLGEQTWLSSTPIWAREWFELEDGSFVYGAFVFLLLEGEVSPLADHGDAEKWIDVDLSEQRARAMVGDRAVFTAPISSGAPPFESPKGSFAIEPDGRIAVEKMTASQAGYEPGQARYEVERVLFTQYLDRNGNALHLNYWRPHSVFGRQATSHGCIGMELHEAQYFWLFADAGTRIEIHD